MYCPQVGKSSANRASKAVNKKAANAAAEDGSAALSAVFAKGSKALEDLRKVTLATCSQPSNDTLWAGSATTHVQQITCSEKCCVCLRLEKLKDLGKVCQRMFCGLFRA
jgi:hypothetical protein